MTKTIDLDDRATVIAILTENGNKADRSALYADAYLEYREATANLAKNGAVVQNPRTGVPLDNPYAKVRDRAFEKLRKLGGMKTNGLW